MAGCGVTQTEDMQLSLKQVEGAGSDDLWQRALVVWGSGRQG